MKEAWDGVKGSRDEGMNEEGMGEGGKKIGTEEMERRRLWRGGD